jgi:hypothetical protein
MGNNNFNIKNMTKQIQPITIDWVAGQQKTAQWFEINSAFDDLNRKADLDWGIRENYVDDLGNNNPGDYIQTGRLVCTGSDYTSWTSTPDANTWIIDWAAQQLSLVLIPA